MIIFKMIGLPMAMMVITISIMHLFGDFAGLIMVPISAFTFVKSFSA